MNISKTTVFGYVRLLFCVAIGGHIVFTLFSKGPYYIDAPMGVAYIVVWTLIDKLLGAVESHFTQDKLASTPPDTTTTIVSKETVKTDPTP